MRLRIRVLRKDVPREELYIHGTRGASRGGHPEVVEDRAAVGRPIELVDLRRAGEAHAVKGILKDVHIPCLDRLSLSKGGDGIDVSSNYGRSELRGFDECGP